MRIILSLLFVCFISNTTAGTDPAVVFNRQPHNGEVLLQSLAAATQPDKVVENRKLVAILLAVTLGPFGAHRIYLGTDHQVPLFYVLTLGGGLGILPLTDIIALLSTKELSAYTDNARFFMWTGKRSTRP